MHVCIVFPLKHSWPKYEVNAMDIPCLRRLFGFEQLVLNKI